MGTEFMLICFSFFVCNQEDPSKLSDQQEAVKWAQNPYPIYAAVNVRPNISSGDFAGMNMAGFFWFAKIYKFLSPTQSQLSFVETHYSGNEQLTTDNKA